jgi:hypothetical protein
MQVVELDGKKVLLMLVLLFLVLFEQEFLLMFVL